MLQFLTPLASLASSFMESKIEQTKAKGAVAKAKAEAEAEVMKTAATHSSKWELIMAQSTQGLERRKYCDCLIPHPLLKI